MLKMLRFKYALLDKSLRVLQLSTYLHNLTTNGY